jgi:hypothetical protein
MMKITAATSNRRNSEARFLSEPVKVIRGRHGAEAPDLQGLDCNTGG